MLRVDVPVWRFRLELWQAVLILAVAPLCALNFAVGYFGSSVVFPLSPFFVRNKLHALGQYAMHRPVCAFTGHDDVDVIVAEAERTHRLPRGLLAALVQVESARLPHRISPAGAMGPAQLIPSTAESLQVTDPFNTRQAIDAGARLLSGHLRRYRNIRLAVAAYNAGPGAVGRSVPRNGETEVYVAKVMSEYARNRRRRPGAELSSIGPPARAPADLRRVP
jgi:hypothetical protein